MGRVKKRKTKSWTQATQSKLTQTSKIHLLENIPSVPPDPPSTLMECAARATAQRAMQTNDLNLLLSQHDGVIQLAVGHLRGQMLVDYIVAKEGLFDLSFEFPQYSFDQIFIRLLEERKSKKNSKQLRNQMSELLDEFEKNVEYIPHNLHRTTAFLGLSNQFKQKCVPSQDDENKFILSFMRIYFYGGDLMTPTLAKIKRKLPDKQTHFLFPDKTSQWKKGKGRIIAKPGWFWFYRSLRSMTDATKAGSYHEAIALGVGVVSEQFAFLSEFDKMFQFYLYGMLAMSMAKFWIKPAVVFGALAHLNQFVGWISHYITLNYFHQKVYADWGQFKLENKTFERMFHHDFCPPVPSALFSKLFTVHVESELKRIENILMEFVVNYHYHRLCSCPRRPLTETENIERKILKLKKMLAATRQRVDINCKRTKYISFHFLNFISQLEIVVNVYANCNDMIYFTFDMCNDTHFQIANVYEYKELHLHTECVRLFCRHRNYLKDHMSSLFMANTTDLVEKEQERSNMASSCNIGDMYFTLALLCLSSHYVENSDLIYIKRLWNLSVEHYQKATSGRHYRLNAMKAAYPILFESVKHLPNQVVALPNFTPELLSVPPCDPISLQDMLTQESDLLPQIIKFGADSIGQCTHTSTHMR